MTIPLEPQLELFNNPERTVNPLTFGRCFVYSSETSFVRKLFTPFCSEGSEAAYPSLNPLPLFRKLIPLVIIDEESYEKSLIMYVNIGDPRHIAGKVAECRLFLEVKLLERRNKG